MKAKSARRWAYMGLALGGAGSLVGNVASTVLTASVVHLAIRVPQAVFWPLATYVAIEVLTRTDWVKSWTHNLARLVLIVPVGVVAAAMSYVHLHHLMKLSGEIGLAQGIGPLAVDGLLFGCTFVLLVTRAVSTPAVDNLVDTPAAVSSAEDTQDLSTPMTYATAADVQESEAAFRGDLTTPVDIPLDSDGTPEDTLGPGWGVQWTDPADVPLLDVDIPSVLPSWLDGLADRTGPVDSVQAAPLAPPLPQRNASRLTAADRQMIRSLAAVGREVGLYTVGEIRELLAAYYEVSVKTIQRAEVMS